MCKGMVRQFLAPAWVIVPDWILTDLRVCNEMLHVCKKPELLHIDINEDVDSILAGKPDHIRNDDFVDNLYKEMSESEDKERKVLKVVQMSDVHLDFQYTEGTISNCGDILCCRESSGWPYKEEHKAAGPWGAHYCDLPVPTYQSMLDYMVEEIDPDFVLWTGDNSAHDIWENTSEQEIAYTIKVSDMLRETTKDREIQVYPSIGNHDVWIEE